ncbi:MAG: hypothetical protein WD535_02055, partial [Thermaerobacterales bacterium]
QGFAYEAAALVLLLYAASGPVGAVGGGLLADRLGRKAIILGSQILGPLAVLAALTASGWPAAAAFVFAGVMLSATFSVGVVYGQELMPGSPATVSGFMAGFAWGTAGLVLGPLGAVADRYGLAVGFGTLAALALLAAVLLLPLPETGPRRGGQVV